MIANNNVPNINAKKNLMKQDLAKYNIPKLIDELFNDNFYIYFSQLYGFNRNDALDVLVEYIYNHFYGQDGILLPSIKKIMQAYIFNKSQIKYEYYDVVRFDEPNIKKITDKFISILNSKYFKTIFQIFYSKINYFLEQEEQEEQEEQLHENKDFMLDTNTKSLENNIKKFFKLYVNKKILYKAIYSLLLFNVKGLILFFDDNNYPNILSICSINDYDYEIEFEKCRSKINKITNLNENYLEKAKSIFKEFKIKKHYKSNNTTITFNVSEYDNICSNFDYFSNFDFFLKNGLNKETFYRFCKSIENILNEKDPIFYFDKVELPKNNIINDTFKRY